MKKINIGISNDIDFKLKNYSKNFYFNKINKKQINFDGIIITSKTILDYKIINSSKKLKLIFIMSLHLITNIEIRKIRKDIKIIWFDKNSKKILEKITATPEFIFGLIILLSKNFLKSGKLISKNIWNPKKTALYANNKMLSQSTLGIIGYGRIGKKLNLIAKSFKMKTLIYSNKKLKDKKSFQEIARKSDFVSINLPLNNKTQNIINQNFFKKMKHGSYFINTSKGRIVNYYHLLKYLGKNIKAAALDVYDVEDSNDPGIIKLCSYAKKNDNLLLTPHVAGSTSDSIIKLQKHCLDIIKNYFNIS
jgi:phosphoglycerate dehydrogenase-like enzyme